MTNIYAMMRCFAVKLGNQSGSIWMEFVKQYKTSIAETWQLKHLKCFQSQEYIYVHDGPFWPSLEGIYEENQRGK
jgi:hypothetical protein